MNSGSFPAHIRMENKKAVVQTVEEHCRNTAANTSAMLKTIGMEKTGELLGLIHDLGKMTGVFADYIQRASKGEPVQKGSVNHTFAAVKLFSEDLNSAIPSRKLTAELLAFASGSHHGLFDCIGPDRKNGFTHRLNTEESLYTESSENFYRFCCSRVKLDSMFDTACEELEPKIRSCTALANRDPSGSELCF